MSKPVKVLYIMGAGRSGTTILDMLLGQLDGYISTGELINICNKSATCGCGESVHEGCKHWDSILLNAFDTPEKLEQILSCMDQSRPSRVRFGYLNKIVKPNADQILKEELKDYLDNLDQLYQSIAMVSGVSVIVDSSKSPPYGYMLSLLPSVELYVIHLIRDARAVVYSWEKGNYDPAKDASLKRGFSNSLKLWIRSNLATSLILSRMSQKYLRIKYKDFVQRPADYVNLIQDFVGHVTTTTPFIDEKTFKFSPVHTVDGNPVRFNEKSEISIRFDDKWREKLSPRKRIISHLSTYILSKYYDLTKSSIR